jgi:transposase InsO family protein
LKSARVLANHTFPHQSAPRFLLLDHDQKYRLEIPAAIRSLSVERVRTSIHNPWQNGVTARWVGTRRRNVFDHVIALNEHNLKRLLGDCIRCYHDDRIHLGLTKENPGRRVRSASWGCVVSHARLGGLHHRYDRAS